MAATATVSLDTYLRTSYRPDVELVDGQLKEKPLVSMGHSRVQGCLFMWFENHEEWNVMAGLDTRTAVPSGVRLPDVVLVEAGPVLFSVLEQAPLLAIEVRSQDDKQRDLDARASDLTAAGCRYVWLLDPAERSAQRWERTQWRTEEATVLRADAPVYIDLQWLWNKVFREIGKIESR